MRKRTANGPLFPSFLLYFFFSPCFLFSDLDLDPGYVGESPRCRAFFFLCFPSPLPGGDRSARRDRCQHEPGGLYDSARGSIGAGHEPWPVQKGFVAAVFFFSFFSLFSAFFFFFFLLLFSPSLKSREPRELVPFSFFFSSFVVGPRSDGCSSA